MGHMQPQIVGPTEWWQVETTDGTCWVQCEFVGRENVKAVDLLDYLPEGCHDTQDIMNWEFFSGYGARLSAPGYTDCTDWTCFDTQQEAHDHLAEMFELCPICLGDIENEVCHACLQTLTSEEIHDELVEFMCENVTMAEVVSDFYSELYEKYANEVLTNAYQKKVTEYETKDKAPEGEASSDDGKG